MLGASLQHFNVFSGNSRILDIEGHSNNLVSHLTSRSNGGYSLDEKGPAQQQQQPPNGSSVPKRPFLQRKTSPTKLRNQTNKSRPSTLSKVSQYARSPPSKRNARSSSSSITSITGDNKRSRSKDSGAVEKKGYIDTTTIQSKLILIGGKNVHNFTF